MWEHPSLSPPSWKVGFTGLLLCFRVNVCGGQCCQGWSKAPGSQRCTKRKSPCSLRPCGVGEEGLFSLGNQKRGGHGKGAGAVLDTSVSGGQSTPLSAAFVTIREGLGPGNVGWYQCQQQTVVQNHAARTPLHPAQVLITPSHL